MVNTLVHVVVVVLKLLYASEKREELVAFVHQRQHPLTKLSSTKRGGERSKKKRGSSKRKKEGISQEGVKKSKGKITHFVYMHLVRECAQVSVHVRVRACANL